MGYKVSLEQGESALLQRCTQDGITHLKIGLRW